MTHTKISAVDELAALRATQAHLLIREQELCDEILSSATENDTHKVTGSTQTAVIETRNPRKIDLSKLPHDILDNPAHFKTEALTTILLWPHASSPQEHKDIITPHDTSLETQLDPSLETPLAPMNTQPEHPPEHHSETTEFAPEPELQSEQMSAELTPSEETPLDPGSIAPNAANVATSEPSYEQAPSSLHDEDQIPCGDSEDGNESAEGFDAPFGEHKYDANAPRTELPPINAQDLANAAEQVEAPTDLRPTAHTDLPPLGSLDTEELEIAFDASNGPLLASPDAEAITQAQALQSQFDESVAAAHIQAETEEAEAQDAAFSTRRIIGAPL
jgi:hypothetical protein